MDRCALFVDAGYALADGALAVHGTRNRDSVSWDYPGLLKLLGSLSRDRTGLPLLRCYWYDTVSDGSRAAEHDTLADIPGVKLRLSKARPSRKEGVEAEIRKDLTALARNRAVSDVIIVSAEEDLGPVIAEVQDLGIRTILLHIANEGSWAMSRSLRQECDDVMEMAPGHLRPYVDLISGAEPQQANAGYRELAASAVQSSEPVPAIEAPAVRLYRSAVAAEYQHAGQFAGLGNGQGHDHRDPARGEDASRFGRQLNGGHGEVLDSAAIQRSPDRQQSSLDQQLQAAGLAQAQALQAEAAQAQIPAAQIPAAQIPAPQPQTVQSQTAQPTTAQAAASGDAGLGHGGFAGQDLSRGQNGQLGQQQGVAFDQRSAGNDGLGRPSSVPGVASAGQSMMHGQSGLGQSDVAQNALTQSGLSQSGFGQNGAGQASPRQDLSRDQNGASQNRLGHNRLGQNGAGHSALGQNGAAQIGQGQNGQGQNGQGQNGLGQNSPGHSALGHNGAGQHGLGQNGPAQNDDLGLNSIGQNGPGQHALGHTSVASNGQQGTAGPMTNAFGGGQPGSVQSGGALHGGGQYGGFAPQSNVSQQSGAAPLGGGQHGGALPSGAVPSGALPPGGLQAQGVPGAGMPVGQPGTLPGQGTGMQGNGLQPGGMQPGGLPPAVPPGGMAGSHGGLSSNGAASGVASGGRGGMPMGSGQQPNGSHHHPGSQQPGMPMQAGRQGRPSLGQAPRFLARTSPHRSSQCRVSRCMVSRCMVSRSMGKRCRTSQQQVSMVCRGRADRSWRRTA